jgi:hypothetical protein
VAVPIWHGAVKDGKILFDDPARLKQYVPTLDGKRVEVVVRREVRHKSRNQRSYLHAALKQFADHKGVSLAYLKALLKLKFLWDGEKVDEGGLPVVPSTEDLSMEQYGEFIDNVVRIAAEYGCVIASPDYMEA